jgi:hypothetical protein
MNENEKLPAQPPAAPLGEAEPVKYINICDQQQWQEMSLEEKNSYLNPEWEKWNEAQKKDAAWIAAFDYASKFPPHDLYGHIRQEAFVAGAKWSAGASLDDKGALIAEKNDYLSLLWEIIRNVTVDNWDHRIMRVIKKHQNSASSPNKYYPEGRKALDEIYDRIIKAGRMGAELGGVFTEEYKKYPWSTNPDLPSSPSK